MDNMDELKQVFFTECAELLTDMEERLLKLDPATCDKSQLNAIFRCAHSIKGGAGAFGLDIVMHFTHATEALLDALREGRLLPTREIVDLLLKATDIITQMLNTVQEGRDVPENMGIEVRKALASHTPDGEGIAPPPPVSVPATNEKTTYEIGFAPGPELLVSGNEPLLIFAELRRLGTLNVTADTSRVPPLPELPPLECHMAWSLTLTTTAPEAAIQEAFEFVAHISTLKITRKETAKPVTQSEDGSSRATHVSSIRVDLEKVDRLVNMVGELVITEAMLRAQMHDLPPERLSTFLRGLDDLSHHTRELQEAVMSVRMQPVKSVFSRMPRIVRDTAAMLGKDIQLVMAGENTEVDKTVIEQLSDPLTHMIRNSVDHGIEKPDERVWNDKPAHGTIHLSADHRSGRIVIEIADDGAGINREKVLKKAREKGLVAHDAVLSDEEIDHLIFLPGFSTAEKVTNVSGRGVGMDVVRRNIEGLGGAVHITNHPGKGSIFTVSLPLTLAILDGMIVRIGQENYIIPIISIIETVRPQPGQIHHLVGQGDVINVRGAFLPLIHLHQIFGISGAQKDSSRALIVLVESGKETIGLVVDELVGQQQVVIKSLEGNSDPVEGISGATILGDGKVSLILDIDELKRIGRRPSSVSSAA